MRRLPRSQIPAATQILLKKQDWRCPLCGGSLRANAKKNPVLDHCHSSGAIRDVLCRNCNGIEGKIKNLVRRARNGLSDEEYLNNLIQYWIRHAQPQHGGVMHPTHKTKEEKRLARLELRRKSKARAKEGR